MYLENMQVFGNEIAHFWLTSVSKKRSKGKSGYIMKWIKIKTWKIRMCSMLL